MPNPHPSDIRTFLQHIGFGKKNARNAAELQAETGFSRRQQRILLHEVDGSEQTIRGKKMTVVIGSGVEGYWICDSFEEANETTNHMRAASKELLERIARREQAVEKAFPEGSMQKALF